MADSVYTIVPNPHWVIIDNFSKLPDGAAIYTYRSLDPSVFKPAFQDAGGLTEYGQPITGFANGTMPPIFWQFDPDNPTDTYYIRVYDSSDTTTQNFLWDFNGLSGSVGGGGGGTIVNIINIKNTIVNNILYRNIGSQASVPTFLTIAPSNNAGFVGNPANVNGSPAPDITFQKNNTTATDTISFPDFTPFGVNQLGIDVTPVFYFNYSCSIQGAGELYKYIQIPIEQNVQTLSQQTVSLKIYARVNTGNSLLSLSFRQFFGDGGGSPDVITQIGSTISLSSDWAPYTFNSIVIPDVTGGTPGACGNAGLFLLIQFPLNTVTNIDVIKPSMYFGNMTPEIDFVSNDEVDAIVNSPRTGDIRTALNNFLPGWINMNDGTIGSLSSGGTSRANVDTYPLFNLIWNTFNTNQALAPMYTSAGAATAYGADPASDFVANNRLSLTRNLGRVMAGSLPVSVSQAFTNVGNVLTVASTASFFTGVPVVVSGGGLPTPLIAGRTYYAIQLTATTLSLAISAENAILGTAIVLTTNAAGTVTVPAHALGSFLGEEKHLQIINELAPHNHPGTFLTGVSAPDGSSPPWADAVGANTVSPGVITGTAVATQPSAANQVPFNVMQPTVFMNVFIKL